MISRRSLITGLVSFVAAPAIVRASSLMPVKVIGPQLYADEVLFGGGAGGLYGKSPAMELMQIIDDLNRKIRELTMIPSDLLTSSS